MRENKQVILVTSGAVGCGRGLLRKQLLLNRSLRDTLFAEEDRALAGKEYNAAAAAAGQFALMSLYETLFATCGIEASQFLVTQAAFTDPDQRKNLEYSLNTILGVGMIPIVNENDAVSGNQGYAVPAGSFSDNDGLASLMAQLTGASVMLLLTDVAGLYDRPPSAPGAKVVDASGPNDKFLFGTVSPGGRGGMESKVQSALRSLEMGIDAVVMASGHEPKIIGRLMKGEVVGTLFSRSATATTLSRMDAAVAAARAAREAQRVLQAMTGSERSAILHAVAAAIEKNVEPILAANALDVAAAAGGGVDAALKQRLGLTAAKLGTVVAGLRTLADSRDPVGAVLEKRELSEGLILEKQTTSLGVICVVFEARPEALPQIAALALRAGCALLLKGGSEARRSNACLHGVVAQAIFDASQGRVARAAVTLLPDREALWALLESPEASSLIDLVVPRGSAALVREIKSRTRVPVLGHADGVCHVFVDKDADARKAAAVAVDAKADYPAACNACETLLLHADTLASGKALEVVGALRAAGVELRAAPGQARDLLGPSAQPTDEMKHEYGALICTVAVVPSLDAAVAHINAHGSSHTETIVTESAQAAQTFLTKVDSACVFHNASTRFADGFRFGLGAELGISTGRIHARGPVGVEGFLTTKWLLHSDDFHTQKHFADNLKAYTHKDLPLD